MTRTAPFNFPLIATDRLDLKCDHVVGQAMGRWGNWFNQELYGRASTLPWALRIDPAHRPADTPAVGLYQPTFLYECLWDLAVAAVLIWA